MELTKHLNNSAPSVQSMDDKIDENKSEWNEQQLFAKLFFDINTSCKQHQANRNIFQWEATCETKISLVMGVANKEEKEKLIGVRKDLISEVNRARKTGNTAQLQNALFYADSEIDTIACSHLPFLKINKQSDIEGL